MDIESAVNYGFFKACRTYNKQSGVTFGTYACRVVQNELNMEFRGVRRKRVDKSLDEDVYTDNCGNELKLADIVVGSEDIEYKCSDDYNTILTEIWKLKGKEREIAVGHLITGVTDAEIAKKVGISQSYTTRMKNKVLMELRERLVSQGISY